MGKKGSENIKAKKYILVLLVTTNKGSGKRNMKVQR